MKVLHTIAWILLVVGGLNWLLAAFGGDLGGWLDASWWQSLIKVVYVLVGLSAVFEIFTHRGYCKHCEKRENVAPTM